jgi:hypothetical protein
VVHPAAFPERGNRAWLRFRATCAVLAPSGRNTLPWQFRLDRDTALECARTGKDRRRWSPRIAARIITCGSALANLRKIAPCRVVSIDETLIKTNIAAVRGAGLRGQRLRARVPHGHWKTLTFIAALRYDRGDAPCMIDEPSDGDGFTAPVEQMQVPTRRRGDILGVDNLGTNKEHRARRATRRAGAPDAAAHRARSIAEPWSWS